MKRRTLISIIVLITVLASVIAGMVVALYADIPVRIASQSVGPAELHAASQPEEQTQEVQDTAENVDDAIAEAADEPAQKAGTEQEKTEAKAVEEPEVAVPEGPWEVKNAATGKICLFGQKEDMSLYLEQDGKTLWSQPFKGGKLCGNAAAVDYYNNGKLQYAFAAGSKIYLYDRLGRPVKGFPTELGKEILLGPAVYDFNGLKRYNILVLHADNSIQMYNFKGVRPDKWKGIAPGAKILSLPELITEGKNSFWLVRTAAGEEKWPFYGGEKLK